MTFIWAIILLGILIFVHELGHFLFAKLVGVRVLKFSLGFGPKILGRKFGDTEYQLSAVPLGGYVKMLGEEPGDELSAEDRKSAFNHKAIWKRALIILAGPVFNIIFAAMIFTGMFLYGVPLLSPEVGKVMEGTPAEAVGLISGDRIVMIDDNVITEWTQMTSAIHGSAGKELRITIRRGEREFDVNVVPESRAVKNIFGEEKKVGLIGITPSGAQFTKRFSPTRAVLLGSQRTVEISVLTVVAIGKLVQRIIPAKEMGGPILIMQLAEKRASEGLLNFLMFMAVISVNLGIINLFPIPILDGGHMMFLGYEAVFRRSPSEKAMIFAQKIGLALILMLMAFTFYNDILRVVSGNQLP